MIVDEQVEEKDIAPNKSVYDQKLAANAKKLASEKATSIGTEK